MQVYGFGDVRLDRCADVITEQIVATGSLVARLFGGGRKGELAAGRFLGSPKVTPEAILDVHSSRTATAAQGRRIVVIQDTTEVNFSGRDRSRKGRGRGQRAIEIGLVEVREIDPPALAHRAGVPRLEERRAGLGGDAD